MTSPFEPDDPAATGPPPPTSVGGLPLYAPPPPPPPASRGRSPLKLVGVLVGVFALLGATAFAITAMNQPDGASSPEAAVHHLFDAVSHRDALGVVESLPANERDVLRDPLVDITEELQRLGVLSSFKLGSVPGAEIRVEDLQLTTTPVARDVVKVNVVGGSISGHSIPDEIPIGSRLRSIIENDFHDKVPSKVESFSQDLAEGHVKLVTVKDGGGWHVSIGYSIAEAIRGDDPRLPDFATAPKPVGSASPDGAVRDLVDAAVAEDATKAVTLMDPNEDRALYDYASLFLPASSGDHSTSVKVTKLDLTPEGSGSIRRVRVGAFAVTIDSDEENSHISYDGRCIDSQTTFKDDSEFGFGSGFDDLDDSDDPMSAQDKADMQAEAAKEKADAEKPQHVCPGQTSSTDDNADGSDASVFGEIGILGTSSTRLGITVVLVDGRWYVSPVRTVLDTVVESLRHLQPSDIDKYGKSLSKFFDDDSMDTGSSSSVGTSITGQGSSEMHLPNGAVLNDDGSITKADGTVVQPDDPGYDQLLDPAGPPDSIAGNSTGTVSIPPTPTTTASPSTSTSTTSTSTTVTTAAG